MADWTGATKGALSGATTGATLGSAIPGIGTAIGGGVGGLVGGITGLFGNKKKKKNRLSTLDKRQQELNAQQHQSILGQGPLADLYNYDPEKANDVFDKNIANPAYRDLNERAIPSVTGQFRSNGLMNSSYSGDAVARLARDVQESLNGKRAEYLYGEQNNARNAKRNAIENLQDRQTFAYDKNPQNNGGFDLDSILKSVSPEMLSQLTNAFKPKAGVS